MEILIQEYNEINNEIKVAKIGKKPRKKASAYMLVESESVPSLSVPTNTIASNKESFINKVICGDSAVILKSMPSSSVDLTVTSPPYDDIRDYNGFTFLEENIIKELFRVTKSGGVVVWVVGDSTIKGSESGSSFRQALKFMEHGFKLHDTMIYEKNTSSFPASKSGNRYTQIFEYMFVFCKDKIKTANLISDKPNKWAGHTNWGKNTNRLKNGELQETSDIKPVPEFSPRNNIWKYNVGKGFNSKDKESHEHPAIFPEQLAEDHILSWSNEGDIVLDPFSGSGTTLKMAKKNGRNYIGIDISDEYCKLAERILQKY
uniref:site-specific DNA-methyltransferase (cytosine-N(4)-specific) n=1 Tax=viral metagenome TaxID=1070528 RepID=A0A6C0I8G1_9ZZZZ